MWIKICGVTDSAAARVALDAGANAVGLNFYPRSRRYLTVDAARQIAADIDGALDVVGVFVNHSASEIHEAARACNLRIVQLAGDEPADLLTELRDYQVIRSFRVDTASGLGGIDRYLRRCQELQIFPHACLVDSRVAGSYGGTGHTAPWSLIAEQYDCNYWPALVLAGGLTPENVSAAIQMTHPWGVDVASGVEDANSCKDRVKVQEFVSNARSGWRATTAP